MSLHNVIVISRQSELQQFAQQIAAHVFAADDIVEAVDLMRRISPDLVLTDRRLSTHRICGDATSDNNDGEAPVVVIGDNPGNTDHDAVCETTYHFFDSIHDGRLQTFIEQLDRGRYQPAGEDTDRYFCDPLAAAAMVVGTSEAICQTIRMIKLVAASQCNPILVVGEMGTGKELAAKAIHRHRCPDREFIAVNCASLSANLLESELFGHEKGAFTSAEREKTGLLELAGDGCIFLDEISEMPKELQAKILRVIQEKTFRKVGGTKEIQCRATIIASSNRNLIEEVRAKRFRGDLYHRLSIFPVVLEPLRSEDRRADIRLLADFFLKTSAICPDKTAQISSITQLALEALEGYHWPGNVRELRNVIERAILLETANKISLNSIIINPEAPGQLRDKDAGEKIKDFSLAKAEQELIARVLKETNWQKTKAAELLGISRATLYAKVKQHNLELSPTACKKAEAASPMAVA